MIANCFGAEKMKLKASRLFWLLTGTLLAVVLFAAAYTGRAALAVGKNMMKYGYMSPFLAPYMCFTFELLVTGILSAVHTGADFKNRTACSVIAGGTRRAQYYFGKLFFLFFITGSMHLFCILAFSVWRICRIGMGKIPLPLSRYLLNMFLYFLMTMLQLWAYISWCVMCAFVCRQEAVACGICILTIYMEGILGQYLAGKGFWLFLYTPQGIVHGLQEAYVETGRILSAGFFFNGIPPLMILTVTTACGVRFFCRSDLK